jgi:hypothetical protein
MLFAGILLGVSLPLWYWSGHATAVFELSGIARVSWTPGSPWWTHGSTSVDFSGAFLNPSPSRGSAGAGANPLEPLTRLRDVESVNLTDALQIQDDQLSVLSRLLGLRSLLLGTSGEPWIAQLGPSPRGDEALGHLAGLTMLDTLDLSGSRVTDDGLKQLLPLTRLGDLALGDTQISDVAIPTFLALKSLQNLDLSRTKVTKAGLDTLMRQRPDIYVQHETLDAGGGFAPAVPGAYKP